MTQRKAPNAPDRRVGPSEAQADGSATGPAAAALAPFASFMMTGMTIGLMVVSAIALATSVSQAATAF